MVDVTDLLFRAMLERHPADQGPSVEAIQVEVSGHPEELKLAFEFSAGIQHLVLSQTALDPARLWEHTCAELFVGLEGGGYAEWNFSPSGQATRFDFSGYRARSAASFQEPVEVSVVRRDRAVRIVATGPLLRGLSGVVGLGLAAVARAPTGGCSYWALQHSGAEPDFHDARGFALDARGLFV